MEKSALRQIIREKKRALTDMQIQTYSAQLAEQLFRHPAYQAAKAVYGYLSYNQEVRTLPILRRALADGKRVAVPKVLGGEMAFIWMEDLSQVAPGYCSIPEPVADGPVAHCADALVLMPGLAFDRMGHRLGYGGGFYDRFLSAEPNHPTLALCYDFQLLDFVQTQAHDLPVDVVLSAPDGDGK